LRAARATADSSTSSRAIPSSASMVSSVVAIFASSLFLGTSLGVAAGGMLIEAVGYAPVFVGCGVGLLALGIGFNLKLARRR
jgi:predicted MFS family arabinose efflux permease